ncbi:MAG: NAD(P)/FAD-dependent oxidoreductase [Nostoc sp.]|uniref:FAD-dependent oxidoreductase n=1 Tax=Nostoc sp. TaxID=1180 RepID=UPI002FF820D7
MDIVIVGAGPAGLFLAHRLLAQNPRHTVKLYDCNQNPTGLESFDSRGFGLGLGARVQRWLNSIEGLGEQLASQGIQFTNTELILIPRRTLCALLVRSLLMHYGNRTSDESSRLSLHFNVSVVDVDLARREIVIERESGDEKVAYDLLVGADGIHSTIRSAMIISKPDEIDFQQQQRPEVWKVLQLPMQAELQKSPPRLIRLQKRSTQFGLVFGACLPRKDGHLTALIFWQPIGSSDQVNPCGITTVEELQQLLQEMFPKKLPALKLDPEQAAAFLEAQPGHEYWSQCRCYHHLEGGAVLIGDAAHSMFSLLGQGCSAAISDAVVLDSLLGQHGDQLSLVLPQFSAQQVEEGHAASDLSLIALIVYHPWLGLFYRITTLVWVFVLRQPSIVARLNQVGSNYIQVLRENRLWIWLAKKLLPEPPKVSKLRKI